MRVLLVDHDSEGLEAIARAIRGVIELDCVTSKGDAMLLLRQNPYDVLIACERAVDGSGLDLLGRTTKTAVPLKRIFAAAPERLQLLGPRLAPFKVQRTINYPIDLEELWLAIAQVTSGPNDDTDGTIEHVVLDERGQSSSTSRSGVRRQPAFAAAPAAPAAAPPAPAPQSPPPAPMTAAAASATRPATVARIIPKPQLPPPQPMLPHASTGTSGSYRAPVVTRPPPPMRATAPVPQMPPMSPMPVAPSLNSVTNPAPAWVAEPTPEDDFAAVAAQARMGVQQKNSQEAARRGKSRVVIASTAAVLVAGAVFAFQNFYDPGRAEREARQAAISAEAARLAEAQKHTDNVSRIEVEIETAIMSNQLDAARNALANLSALAPDHPRRELLDASINRAALSSAQGTRGVSRTRSVMSEDEVRAQRATRVATEAPPPARAVSAPARSSSPGNSGSGNTRLAANTERSRPSSAGSAEAPINIPPPRSRPDVTFSGRTLEASDQRTATRSALTASTSIPPGVSGISSAPTPLPERVPLPVAPPIGASILSAVPGATAAPTAANASGAAANVPVPATPVNVKAAKILKRVNPVMPSVAAQKKLKGYVVLAFVIDAEGNVRDVEVTESTPERIFDIAARDAVRKWTYEPRQENGVAVESRKSVKLIFE
jgi:protein TonB